MSLSVPVGMAQPVHTGPLAIGNNAPACNAKGLRDRRRVYLLGPCRWYL